MIQPKNMAYWRAKNNCKSAGSFDGNLKNKRSPMRQDSEQEKKDERLGKGIFNKPADEKKKEESSPAKLQVIKKEHRIPTPPAIQKAYSVGMRGQFNPDYELPKLKPMPEGYTQRSKLGKIATRVGNVFRSDKNKKRTQIRKIK